MSETLSLGLVQMSSGPNRDENVNRVRMFLDGLAGCCDLAVFPENVLCLGRNRTVRGAARTLPELCEELGSLVGRCGQAAVFGGVPVKQGDSVTNSSLAFAADGVLLARYDKIHLFRLNPDREDGVDETRLYAHGTAPAALEINGWRVGLTICYDLRFPELFRTYIPAELTLCTAAFTAATGKAHWEVLLRARAIENQCFVAGVDQCGANAETGLALHGHTLVADPWGTLVAHIDSREEDTRVVTLRKEAVRRARTRLPALEHIRPT